MAKPGRVPKNVVGRAPRGRGHTVRSFEGCMGPRGGYVVPLPTKRGAAVAFLVDEFVAAADRILDASIPETAAERTKVERDVGGGYGVSA